MHEPWVLLTGNGAFGDTAERTGLHYPVNPSSLLAAQLDGEVISGRRVIGRGLQWNEHPTEALLPILEATREAPPEIVISTGVFSGRSTVTVERIAANVRDFQFADGGGRRPAGEPVIKGGPSAYFATLPIKAMTHAMREQGIPALVSNSASTHGCNSVMYTVLHYIAERGLPMRAGFIHLPDTPEHIARTGSNGPSMDLRLQAEALRVAIEAAVRYGDGDLNEPANEWEW
ncbi:hypothetical protein ABMA32_19150 [Mesorhizobium sp. VNQ89]|uniref:pyroglutamyl-peptidase I family protein n=1 Tax=Mesorhizobium quangtriensis TaxID=3157709 RepID=UPI0032B86885